MPDDLATASTPNLRARHLQLSAAVRDFERDVRGLEPDFRARHYTAHDKALASFRLALGRVAAELERRRTL